MNEYLTIFDNHSEYEKFTNTDKFIFPNVTCCVNNDDIHYNTDYPYEYVDMGLPSGTMWCTKNLGAVLPINDGNYYMYGDTTPYRRPNFEELFNRIAEFYTNTDTNISDEEFNERWRELMVDLMWEKYSQYTFAKITSKEEFKNTGDEYSSSSVYTKYNMTDNKYELDSDNDPVVSTIGGNWKSPGVNEIYELIHYSTVSLETINDKKVFVFTSQINGNRLIFPIIYEGGGVPNDNLYLEDLKMSLLKSNALEPTYDSNHNLIEYYGGNVLLHLYYAITEPHNGPLTNPIVEYVNDGEIDNYNPISYDGISDDFFGLIQYREFPLPIRPIYIPPASIENMYNKYLSNKQQGYGPTHVTFAEIDLLNDYIKNKYEADNNVDLDDPNYTGETPEYLVKSPDIGSYARFYTIGGEGDYDNMWYDYDTSEQKYSGNLCLRINYIYDYHHFALDSEYNIIDYQAYTEGSDVK